MQPTGLVTAHRRCSRTDSLACSALRPSKEYCCYYCCYCCTTQSRIYTCPLGYDQKGQAAYPPPQEGRLPGPAAAAFRRGGRRQPIPVPRNRKSTRPLPAMIQPRRGPLKAARQPCIHTVIGPRLQMAGLVCRCPTGAHSRPSP